MSYLRRLVQLKSIRFIAISLGLIFVVLMLVHFCSSSSDSSAKFYRLARSTTWSSLDLSGKEPNMRAFTDELINDIAFSEKLTIRLMTQNQANLLEGLEGKFFDAILMIVTPNAVLTEKYNMSNPVFITGPVLIVAKNSLVKSLTDLEGKSIGVSRNSSYIFKLNQVANLYLVSYDNMVAALEDVVLGNLSGVVMNAQLAYTYTQAFYKDQLQVVTKPLTDEGIRLLTLWGKPGDYLIEHFNTGLKQLKDTGEYERLINKWDLNNP